MGSSSSVNSQSSSSTPVARQPFQFQKSNRYALPKRASLVRSQGAEMAVHPSLPGQGEASTPTGQAQSAGSSSSKPAAQATPSSSSSFAQKKMLPPPTTTKSGGGLMADLAKEADEKRRAKKAEMGWWSAKISAGAAGGKQPQGPSSKGKEREEGVSGVWSKPPAPSPASTSFGSARAEDQLDQELDQAMCDLTHPPPRPRNHPPPPSLPQKKASPTQNSWPRDIPPGRRGLGAGLRVLLARSRV